MQEYIQRIQNQKKEVQRIMKTKYIKLYWSIDTKGVQKVSTLANIYCIKHFTFIVEKP